MWNIGEIGTYLNINVKIRPSVISFFDQESGLYQAIISPMPPHEVYMGF
jgi:hypothetical protein